MQGSVTDDHTFYGGILLVDGAEEAEEDEGAAMYLLLDGYDTMGKGYMAEKDEGAIGADWAMGAEGAERAEGAMGSKGVMGAEEDEGAAIYLMLDG